MKKKFAIIVLLSSIFSFAQVSIGTSTPNASAILDVNSNEKGFLPPRMTTTARNAITSPAVGLTIYNTDLKCWDTYNGKRWINLSTITSTDVYSPSGLVWMDRNLGASQVATSSSDFNAFGSLFQWGRAADGHQLINWTSATAGTPQTATTTTGPVNTNTPSPAANFIKATSSPYDWRNPQNNNLWQGVNGTNNPCPSGYRIPTQVEWQAEINSWTSQNTAGAFASPLKLPFNNLYRASDDGLLYDNSYGCYWSSTIISTVNGIKSYGLTFTTIDAQVTDKYRGDAFGVRCIKD
jgi:uncharacterized protein (TIGR02145 family)